MGKRPRADKNKRKHATTEISEAEFRKRSKYQPPPAPLSTPAPQPVKTAAPSEDQGAKEVKGAAVERLKKLPNLQYLEISEPRLKSRLLYPNPVCFLTTTISQQLRKSLEFGPERVRNVMIISWLTPINNEGNFICSMHKRRFSAECLKSSPRFVLSVPVEGAEELINAVGEVTGRQVDKFGGSLKDLKFCEMGQVTEAKAKPAGKGGSEDNKFAVLEAEGAEGGEGGVASDAVVDAEEFAVSNCAAHLECQVQSMGDADEKHHLITAKVLRAFVHPSYWNEKQFLPQDEKLPRYMTFLGATKFGYFP